MGHIAEVTGTVVDFDDATGWGHVRDDDALTDAVPTNAVPPTDPATDRFFHCTAIADRSRSIDVGTRVSYRIVAGQPGRWEATDLHPIA